MTNQPSHIIDPPSYEDLIKLSEEFVHRCKPENTLVSITVSKDTFDTMMAALEAQILVDPLPHGILCFTSRWIPDHLMIREYADHTTDFYDLNTGKASHRISAMDDLLKHTIPVRL